MTSLTEQQLVALRDQHESWLRAQPGVVGTGVGMDKTGQIVVKIFSNQMPAATRSAIQQRFSDIPIAIEETGEIRKQAGKPA